MRVIRISAVAFLVIVAGLCLAADWITPASYALQSRALPGSSPTWHHLLGTDNLGRDSLTRLIYGTRVSILLAPAAALLSSAIAALTGGIAGLHGKWVERSLMALTDLFLSLPWLFLLITLRALLPLNTSGVLSSVITFTLLGSLGWAAAARVICSHARSLRHSDHVLLARASGHYGQSLLWRHIVPNLRSVIWAQFWISIPVFILAEANLGMLGMGIAEPLPSWGGLLSNLEGIIYFSPQIWQFAPLILLILVVSSLHIAMQSKDSHP